MPNIVFWNWDKLALSSPHTYHCTLSLSRTEWWHSVSLWWMALISAPSVIPPGTALEAARAKCVPGNILINHLTTQVGHNNWAVKVVQFQHPGIFLSITLLTSPASFLTEKLRWLDTLPSKLDICFILLHNKCLENQRHFF